MTKPPVNFAVFILTNGRPDNVITYKTLERCGYTGKTYIIIDDLDKTKDQYIKNFGVFPHKKQKTPTKKI